MKSYIQWVSFPFLLLLMPAVSAQTVHVAHCMVACPEFSSVPVSNAREIIVRHLFAASISVENGLADWVAYRVLADSVGVASLLPRFWAEDDLMASSIALDQIVDSSPRVVQTDLTGQADGSYRIAEVTINTEDQGRLVPMSSFAGTPYWSDLNYISNLAALPSDLRVGSWSRLDQAVNELAARAGEVFVVSGPLYRIENALSTSHDGLAAQPSAFFKIIATATGQAAFIFPQDLAQHARYCDQLSSLQSIEDGTGLTLFPQLQTPLEDDLSLALGCSD